MGIFGQDKLWNIFSNSGQHIMISGNSVKFQSNDIGNTASEIFHSFKNCKILNISYDYVETLCSENPRSVVNIRERVIEKAVVSIWLEYIKKRKLQTSRIESESAHCGHLSVLTCI